MYQLINGSDAIRRMSDGATIPPDHGNRDYASYLQWVAAGNAPQPAAQPTTQQRVAAAWAKADALCRAGADDNSRARYLAWLIDPASSDERKRRIIAVQEWMDAVWRAYALYRAAPSGDFQPPSDACPFSFWQIAES